MWRRGGEGGRGLSLGLVLLLCLVCLLGDLTFLLSMAGVWWDVDKGSWMDGRMGIFVWGVCIWLSGWEGKEGMG